ncbi:NADH-quinone oxidoreductase subunit C/D [Planctomycetaceae bacterium]|nr:NADH-quinone oxidoreductase subunit C/D [Planctomycetaceae bacterium]
MTPGDGIIGELKARYGESVSVQPSVDRVPTVWAGRDRLIDVLGFLKNSVGGPYRTLYDLTAIDERTRRLKPPQSGGGFTAVYHLLSMDRNSDVRVKVSVPAGKPSVPTATGLWGAANWYEREAWDLFGIEFEGHPDPRRILLPHTWEGHPLRKDHPARRTEMGRFELTGEKLADEEESLRFRPEDWGMGGDADGSEFMFLNMGPHHTGTHGIMRVLLELDGEEIRDAALDIGYHHRGAEKMGERQSWHTYIPYTDRVDYLGGVLNNFPYVLAVETLAGIEVPDRAKVIRVMLAELFRIMSHLVWFGTFAQDLGQVSPVFFAFNDRERAFGIIEAVCGFRMHPAWFRIGGVASDLPRGWETLVRAFTKYMPERLREYEEVVLRNSIIKARTKGLGVLTADEAMEWGVTGPNLRACGVPWDLRKKRPYSGYDQFEFEVPTAEGGDSYDRVWVRFQEMWQSLRIVEQCLNNMPSGQYKSDHPLCAPPRKEKTMRDIETLIDHFLDVSWGPVMPAGEVAFGTEAAKGNNTYYLVSDGGTGPYRLRIRTPSFPHLQTVPGLCRGLEVADLVAILGSIDFVMGDVDR